MILTRSAETTDPVVDLEGTIRSLHRGLLRDLILELTPNGIILHGFATSFYGKQMAQEEILRTGSWPIVENRIVVDD